MRTLHATRCAVLLLLASALPAPAFADLDFSNTTALVSARSQSQDVGATSMVTPDGIDVMLSATATDLLDPGPTYSGEFEYESVVLATGFLTHGFASAEFEASADATPVSIESIPPGSPIFNDGASTIDAAVDLRFSEVGVVTGATPGTPVALSLNVAVFSISGATGANPGFENFAFADMFVRVTDNDNGFVSVERTALGVEIQSVVFDTAVGHHLAIEGRFRAQAKGQASGAFTQYLVEIHEAAGGFWMEPPEGVGFEAPSGTDYTFVSVPEPGQALLALTGAALLAAARTRAAQTTRGR